MSSAYERGNSQPTPREETVEARPEAQPEGAGMLDQVLSLMAGSPPATGFVEPSDVQLLRDVARAFAGQPFSLDPVAIGLILALLNAQFQKAQLSSETVRAMAEQIATTLCNDPTSRQRLETLWSGLSEK